MDRDRAIHLLKKSNALLEGHFLLSSGNHSGSYVQCALLLSRPEMAAEFMQDLTDHFRSSNPDTVIAPAVGGIVVSWEVARLLGKRSLFTERENDRMALRRGFSLEKGERVLIVEDVITTGGSVQEVRELVEDTGAEAVGLGSIVDRSGQLFSPGLPFYSCVALSFPLYPPDVCPLCREGVPLVKPGSR